MTLLPLLNVLSPPAGGDGENPFEYLFGHVLPHPLQVGGEPLSLFGLPVWNIQLFQVLSVALVFLAFAGLAGAIRNGSGGFYRRAMAGWITWIRDEMVIPNLGEKDGRRLLPMFLSVFFFILFMNAFGLVPGGATATASIFVTGGMALITLVCMVGGGMIVQGPIAFWKNLVPHGVPLWLWPLMFVVEIVGLIVKPVALTIRLFANMLGGHLVLLSFMGLAFYFGTNMGPGVGLAVTPVSVGMSVGIMILEGFVALLQAYIFTLLSIIFVGMSLHPDH